MKIINHLLEHKFLLFAIAWSFFITIASLISLSDLNVMPTLKYKDKVVHFVFYFAFTFFWYKGLNKKKEHLLKIAFIGFVYGIVIEIMQDVFTVSRHADIYDVLANSTGIVMAFFVCKFQK